MLSGVKNANFNYVKRTVFGSVTMAAAVPCPFEINIFCKKIRRYRLCTGKNKQYLLKKILNLFFLASKSLKGEKAIFPRFLTIKPVIEVSATRS